MDNDSKIIDIYSRRKELDDNTDTDDYEDWEDDYRLINNDCTKFDNSSIYK